MNYKVLYRKYRPADFKNLVGQDYIAKILKNSIKEEKISHAYIFAGPRGTGKTSTAKIFAKSVNCLNNVDGEACGKCENCLNFNNNTDIIEIDAASNNGVDQIREITNNIKLAPSMSKYKVYIIDEVHMLSQSAFNALLLTLEEPPSHVIFILATTNIESVPITIISRCQRFDFKKISINDLVTRMQFVCKEEGINADDKALEEIAYIADGGLRDALSLLDQLSKDNEEITQEIVINEMGSVSLKSVDKLLDYIEENKYKEVMIQLDEYRKMSLDYKLITKKIMDCAVKRAREIIENGQVKRLSFEDYRKIVFDLTDCLNKINVNVDSYSLIELVLLDFIKTPDIAKKELLTPKAKVTNAKKGVSIQYIDLKVNNCFVLANKEEKNKLLTLWPDFIDELDDNLIKGLIIDTKIVLASAEIVIITTDNESIMAEINAKKSKLSDKFNKYTKGSYEIISITKTMWDNYSKKYIADLKKGIKYTIRDEKEVINENEIENIATNLFSSDKIEIN